MFAPQPPRDDANDATGVSQQETLRRQQMMRFGLMIFLLFLLLDNKQAPSDQSTRGGSSEDTSTYTEIPLNAIYSARINAILSQEPSRDVNQNSMNGTGLYRGSWVSFSDLSNGTDRTINRVHGSALLQLVSVPVRAARDVSYVYGLLHLYRDPHHDKSGTLHVALEAGFPLQGVLVSSQQKLVLFSTPYKSQRLYLRLGSGHHFNDSSTSSITTTSTAAVMGDRKGAKGAGRRLHSDPHHHDYEHLQHFDSVNDGAAYSSRRFHLSDELLLLPGDSPSFSLQEVDAGTGLLQRAVRSLLMSPSLGPTGGTSTSPSPLSRTHRTRRLAQGTAASAQIPAALMQALGIASVAPAQNREVKLTGLTGAGFMSVLLTDQPLQSQSKSNGSSTTANESAGNNAGSQNATDSSFLVSIAIGEPLLPARFKALQSAATPPSLLITLQPNRSSAGRASSFAPVQCLYTLQLSGYSESSPAPATDLAQVSLPLPMDPADPRGTESEGLGDSVGAGAAPLEPGDLPRPPLPSSKNKHLEPMLKVEGAVLSPNCGKEITLEATAFNLELDKLKSKVDTYALAVTLLSLVQVFLVVYQMKHASTQALVSRMSIVAVFAQSLLDANLCMAHLLLCFAFPAIFFGSFIWITIIKLLLFSVFQMRLIINIYQARYAQELSVEGWQGLRARLVALHARFYGAVLLILMISVAFYSRPVVAVLALYSFWVPQIFHSVYSGTKHSLHPVYLIGTTLTRCFIPLYILGCPKNFLALLTIYINPQYLALLSDGAVTNALSSGSGSLHDVSAANQSACWVLVLWLGAQVGVLLLQSVFGPRFFVPKRFLPQRYDYKRPIPAAVRASLMASSSPRPSATVANSLQSAGAGGEDSSSRETTGDVAMTGIRSRTQTTARSSSNSGSGGGLQALLFGNRLGWGGSSGHQSREGGSGDEGDEDLETGSLLRGHREGTVTGSAGAGIGVATGTHIQDRRDGGSGGSTHDAECVICYNPLHLNAGGGDYLITPCDHVFHEECLVRWADVKLECPVCRAALPSLGEDAR